MQTKSLEEKLIIKNKTLIETQNNGETLISWAEWWARQENEQPSATEIELPVTQSTSMGIYM
jgi:hypothetical protein